MNREPESQSKVESRESSAAALAPRLSSLVRYLKIYAALWKTSVTREMSFKGNFLLWILVELAWFGLQLVLSA